MTTIYAAMESAFVGVDPDDPEPTTRLTDHSLECVGADPRDPDRVLVGTFDAGLQVSTDGGNHFGTAAGLDGESVLSVTVSSHDPAVVWAGTEPSAVYRSADGGDTFEERPGLTELPSAEEWSFPPRPHTHHVRWIAVDPRDPERLYVAVEAGALVRTDDGGETWQDRPKGARRDNHTLAVHPDAPGRVYAAAGDGYAVSDDGGDTWAYPQEGLAHRYVWGLAVDPGDPDRVLVSAAHGATNAHRANSATAHVYRRTGVVTADDPDVGVTWTRVTDPGLPTGKDVTRAVFATDGPGTVYAATNRGLFRSDSFGAEGSWERVETGLDWREHFGDDTCRGLVVV